MGGCAGEGSSDDRICDKFSARTLARRWFRGPVSSSRSELNSHWFTTKANIAVRLRRAAAALLACCWPMRTGCRAKPWAAECAAAHAHSSPWYTHVFAAYRWRATERRFSCLLAHYIFSSCLFVRRHGVGGKSLSFAPLYPESRVGASAKQQPNNRTAYRFADKTRSRAVVRTIGQKPVTFYAHNWPRRCY